MKIIIFGCGNGSERLLKHIDETNIKIVCFVDNDLNKKNKRFHGKNIITPNIIERYEYDYIIIASEYYQQIFDQLLKLNISREKIISYYYYCYDEDFNNECNNKVLKEIIKNGSKHLKKHYDIFGKDLIRENYNKNYSQQVDYWSTTSIEYCEKVVENILTNINIKFYKNSILKLLDIGCAKGYFTEAFRKKGFLSYGIDYSDVAIEKAKRNFSQCKFEVMDAINPNFKESSFNLIFMRGFSGCNTHDLNYVKDFVNEYYKILSDNGLFIMAYPSNFSGLEYDGETVNWSMEEIEYIKDNCDFKFKDIIYPEETNKQVIEFKAKRYFYLILEK